MSLNSAFERGVPSSSPGATDPLLAFLRQELGPGAASAGSSGRNCDARGGQGNESAKICGTDASYRRGRGWHGATRRTWWTEGHPWFFACERPSHRSWETKLGPFRQEALVVSGPCAPRGPRARPRKDEKDMYQLPQWCMVRSLPGGGAGRRASPTGPSAW